MITFFFNRTIRVALLIFCMQLQLLAKSTVLMWLFHSHAPGSLALKQNSDFFGMLLWCTASFYLCWLWHRYSRYAFPLIWVIHYCIAPAECALNYKEQTAQGSKLVSHSAWTHVTRSCDSRCYCYVSCSHAAFLFPPWNLLQFSLIKNTLSSSGWTEWDNKLLFTTGCERVRCRLAYKDDASSVATNAVNFWRLDPLHTAAKLWEADGRDQRMLQRLCYDSVWLQC